MCMKKTMAIGLFLCLGGLLQAQIIPTETTALESYDMPGFFLVCTTSSGAAELAQGGNQTDEGQWNIVEGLAGSGVSFMPVALEDHYMRHRGFVCYCDAAATDNLYLNDATFVPPSEGISQSACTIISAPHVPPLMNQCTSVINLGDFEGTVAELHAAWPSSGGANVGAPLSKYTGKFGANLALLGGMQKPLIYQTFDLQVPSPPGILANTTANLKLYKKVDVMGSFPNEQIRFALRHSY